MKIVDVILKSEKEETKKYLSKFGLKYERDIIHTLNCVDNGQIVGTISCSSNVIKCMAVDSNYQGENIAGSLISKIIQYIYHLGTDSIFVYTKPENKEIFLSMGFNEIISTSNTTLLEMYSDINLILSDLKDKYQLNASNYAAIVMNCNPMTNGHLYLIEKCREENENVIIFVVEEDKSYFKFEERYKIVKTECERFDNVVVVPATQYIISGATFPTYFYKDDVDTDMESIELDLAIFKKYFMPYFNISKRYVGSEPFDKLTSKYNEQMKKQFDCLVEIERAKNNDQYISASHVRRLIEENNYEKLKDIVPSATYELVIKR